MNDLVKSVLIFWVFKRYPDMWEVLGSAMGQKGGDVWAHSWGLWGKICCVLFVRNPTGKQKIATAKSKLTRCKARINFYRLAFLMDSCFVGNLISSNRLASLDEVQGHKCWMGTQGETHQPSTCNPVAQYCTYGPDSIFLKGGNPCCWDVWKSDNNSTCSWVLWNKEGIKL